MDTTEQLEIEKLLEYLKIDIQTTYTNINTKYANLYKNFVEIKNNLINEYVSLKNDTDTIFDSSLSFMTCEYFSLFYIFCAKIKKYIKILFGKKENKTNNAFDDISECKEYKDEYGNFIHNKIINDFCKIINFNDKNENETIDKNNKFYEHYTILKKIFKNIDIRNSHIHSLSLICYKYIKQGYKLDINIIFVTEKIKYDLKYSYDNILNVLKEYYNYVYGEFSLLTPLFDLMTIFLKNKLNDKKIYISIPIKNKNSIIEFNYFESKIHLISYNDNEFNFKIIPNCENNANKCYIECIYIKNDKIHFMKNNFNNNNFLNYLIDNNNNICINADDIINIDMLFRKKNEIKNNYDCYSVIIKKYFNCRNIDYDMSIIKNIYNCIYNNDVDEIFKMNFVDVDFIISANYNFENKINFLILKGNIELLNGLKILFENCKTFENHEQITNVIIENKQYFSDNQYTNFLFHKMINLINANKEYIILYQKIFKKIYNKISHSTIFYIIFDYNNNNFDKICYKNCEFHNNFLAFIFMILKNDDCILNNDYELNDDLYLNQIIGIYDYKLWKIIECFNNSHKKHEIGLKKFKKIIKILVDKKKIYHIDDTDDINYNNIISFV